MVALFPFPGILVKTVQTVQKESMKRTDARVQTATETMNILRMVKLFGWEPKVAERLAERREHELRYIKKRQILNLINMNINFLIPAVTMVVTYVTYTVIMKQALTPSTVFSSIAVFDLMKEQLHTIFWMLPLFIQAKVSLDRADDFLRNTELLDEYAYAEKGFERVMLTDASRFDRGVIGFQNASFTWSNDGVNDGTLTSSRRFTLRVDGELVFKRGGFNLIIGPTGSGKTSLLMALLGEMHFIPMTPDGWYHLPRSGGVSYAAQESWIQNETIRDNILFGAPYDEERYREVIYQCGLERDLSLFDAGDKTEVGEKGLTLSGGQKARITLARAVYSSAEILILDDVLAALDVHTARWIVEKCFKGDLIRGRTVLLVTHNVAMASPLADYVVSLGMDGRVASRGSALDAIALSPEVVEDIPDEKKKIEEGPDATAKQSDGKLIVAEEIAEGHVSWDALQLFFKALGGSHVFLFWIFFVGGLLLSEAFLAGQTWFMGHWAEQYALYPPGSVDVTFYLSAYGLLVLAGAIAYATGNTVYIFGAVRAARSIHGRLIEAVLGTTMRWLDTTPTSRVITRVTQDIRALDGPVSYTFEVFNELSVGMLIRAIAVVYLTPVFIFPCVIFAIVGARLGQVYMRAQLAIKREMSNAKAPVLGHFGAAVAGLASIRAYGAQLAFREESYKRINRYSRAGRSFYNMNRWMSLRIDFLGGLFAAGLAAYLIYVPNERVLSSDIGFTLTMASTRLVPDFYWIDY
jgi:ABC-type multidrug transport system fused ATPase/permease subunit